MYRLMVLPLVLALAVPAAANEKATGTPNHAKILAPFLSEQTVLIAHIDLTRIDLDALLAHLAESGSLDKEFTAHAKREAGTVLQALKKAGMRGLYPVVNLEGFPNAPFVFVVVPVPAGADAEAMAKALHQTLHHQVERKRNVLVVAEAATLRRLKDLNPTPHPELARAFAATGGGAMQAVVLLPTTLRRAVEETLPNLPPQVGGSSTKVLTRGFSWAALGVTLSPKLSVRVTVQAKDAEAAQGMARLYDKALTSLTTAIAKDKAALAFFKDFFKNLDTLKELFTPTVKDSRLTLVLNDKELTSLLLPALAKAQTAGKRSQSVNNLKQMALAMHNYHDTYGSFPAHALCDKQGQPLLSWRVAILPYIEENALYQEFHLDEPWDSAHNKKLIARMPRVYRSPASKAAADKTTYVVPVGKDTMFPPGCKGVKLREVTDGLSWTLLIVEVADDHAVTWTRPEDLPYDPKQPLRALAGRKAGHFLAAFADGSVHVISRSIDLDTLRALFTRNGGETIGEIP